MNGITQKHSRLSRNGDVHLWRAFPQFNTSVHLHLICI